jgi:hypothetical protein
VAEWCIVYEVDGGRIYQVGTRDECIAALADSLALSFDEANVMLYLEGDSVECQWSEKHVWWHLY